MSPISVDGGYRLFAAGNREIFRLFKKRCVAMANRRFRCYRKQKTSMYYNID